jgi:transcription antitermination factor NusG
MENKQVNKWFAVYTKPRWEKKVYKLLTENNFEAYCPINKVRKKWSDRYKIVEVPLFTSYVFVNMDASMTTKVRMIDGVLNFVYWNGKPAVVRDFEIDNIKKFLGEYESVELESIDFKTDDNVLIAAGAFMDMEGKVLKELGNFVEIEIKSLGFKLIAKVEKSKLLKS